MVEHLEVVRGTLEVEGVKRCLRNRGTLEVERVLRKLAFRELALLDAMHTRLVGKFAKLELSHMAEA